ncbi:Hypothetical predicted protein [Lecanosticta acicola]|uniref:Dynactin subunit 6 n=1 Tax=Lecanosticta acicola TaxID=111012 RepID=A0AAI8Z0L3_9PEZI|nr:Hypothetical predicted protein [Lecanosticta acicola]
MTSRPAPSKRSSAAAPPSEPKPPLKIHSLAVISERAQITGSKPIEIGENTIIHPHAAIRSAGGSVTIGDNCTVSETAIVGNEEGDVVIGDGVNIETGAIVQAKSVGDGSVIDIKATVGKGAVIGKYCNIAPLCEVKDNEELPDYTVVYGDNQRRINTTVANNAEVRDAKDKGQMMQIELLKKLIPDAPKWRS